MPHSYGYRARTRHLFKKEFKTKGLPHISTYLHTYQIGDLVDVKADPSIQRGMPHKFYHGKTGVVFNVTPRAVGVIIRKIVGNRYLEKRVNVRIEHVRHSACRKEFLGRVKVNAKILADAKAAGEKPKYKRAPQQPREGHVISVVDNLPQTLRPLPFETTI
ncbi:60S ribosomal protein L21A [Tulasnella sp. UAMH 9824]|nr:60S ribosomal protein L21A [Tulasnella sp. UAMH 9824]